MFIFNADNGRYQKHFICKLEKIACGMLPRIVDPEITEHGDIKST
jgi:hypothetical protein